MKINLSFSFSTLFTLPIILILVSGFLFSFPAAGRVKRGNTMAEDIWNLEEAYFANLYKADYEGVLALVHPLFLGWPGSLPKPVGREESAQFMKKLIPRPTQCTIRIEHSGLRQAGDTVLTQYILHVNCPEASGKTKTQSSRITHTWIKIDNGWKLLGGMSIDLNRE